jgi:hypothetical protein
MPLREIEKSFFELVGRVSGQYEDLFHLCAHFRPIASSEVDGRVSSAYGRKAQQWEDTHGNMVKGV